MIMVSERREQLGMLTITTMDSCEFAIYDETRVFRWRKARCWMAVSAVYTVTREIYNSTSGEPEGPRYTNKPRATTNQGPTVCHGATSSLTGGDFSASPLVAGDAVACESCSVATFSFSLRINSVGNTMALSIATGRPLCLPRSMTVQRTNFETLLIAPARE